MGCDFPFTVKTCVNVREENISVSPSFLSYFFLGDPFLMPRLIRLALAVNPKLVFAKIRSMYVHICASISPTMQPRMHANAYSFMHRLCMQTLTLANIHVRTLTRMNAWAFTHTSTRTHACIHTYLHTNINAHTHARTHKRSRSRTCPWCTHALTMHVHLHLSSQVCMLGCRACVHYNRPFTSGFCTCCGGLCFDEDQALTLRDNRVGFVAK